ncbi:hypothetical protein KFZ56_04265 [Virgibacillus sp. NKC19-3]|uniref:hypothetical protein n=1 Tax=Virgibacillus saliphilus TaxID=2831674 RepID=UPI001C9A91B6|nr:hypothetical protein [Virgibacillus sp. NKC19-3]MBY7142320.1 hypothetical protein [Virgibacillus sp. NKC19-3]
MPRYIVHFTFIFLTITALSGVWMRVFPFYPDFTIPYSNILHGHSHLAILGWAFLGVFMVFLVHYWETFKHQKEAITIAITLFIVTILMFVAFLYQGYASFSIVLSTMHIFVEYWAASFIYRQVKSQLRIPRVAGLFIKGGLISLIISSFGPYGIAYISASGMKGSPLYDMAIYFYLHFQYNGWLFLFLIGLFIIVVRTKNIILPESTLKIGFWVYFIALFPGYFLSILWAEELGLGAEVIAGVGGIGQWIGVICVISAYFKSKKDLETTYSGFTMGTLTVTFFLLFLKGTMELGLLIPSLVPLIYDSRNIIIGYLHLTLLGFISLFILTLYLMKDLLATNKQTVYGGIIFFTGFLLNALLLFGQGLTEWLHMTAVPFYIEGLFVASLLLLLGIMILWVSFWRSSERKRDK